MSLAHLAARRGGSLAGSLANGGRLSRPLVRGARLSRSLVAGPRFTRSIGSGGALPDNCGGSLPDSSSSPYMLVFSFHLFSAFIEVLFYGYALVRGARLSRSLVAGPRFTRSIGSGGALPDNCGGSLPDSSSSPYMKAAKRLLSKVKPSEGTVLVIGLLGGTGTILSGVYMGYTYLEDRVAARAMAHVDNVFDEEKQERQRFQNVATGAHHDFMSKSNESTAQIHREVAQLRLEMADLRSEMLALKQKEFKHRQELLTAADLLQRHNVEGLKLTDK